MGREIKNKNILSSENILNKIYIEPVYYNSNNLVINYLAKDINLQKKVIIKEFCPKNYLEENIIERIDNNKLELIKSEYQFDFDEMKDTFLKEGEKNKQLNHKNIIRALDVFSINNTIYIVYDFIEKAITLDKFLAENKLKLENKISIILDILDALIYTHNKDIIHLNLKPNNILVSLNNNKIEIKIVDFSIANNINMITSSIDTNFSVFLPPEHLIPKMYGTHTDIYSAGALLYFLLTNLQPPSMIMKGDESSEKLEIKSEQLNTFLYKNLEEAQIEEDLIVIILKAMKYNYDERFLTVSDIKTELEDLYKIKEDDKQKCSFCYEIIKKKEIKCPFCGEFLNENSKKLLLSSEMVYVEGGSFKMGSNQFLDTKPIHNVTLKSFYISKYQVTQKEYQDLMKTNPSYFQRDNLIPSSYNKDFLPVECVSWFDAIKFCNEKSKQDGFPISYNEQGDLLDEYGKVTIDIKKVKGYRLPTEAEWEFASKGGNFASESEEFLYSGSNNIDEVAWNFNNSKIIEKIKKTRKVEKGLFFKNKIEEEYFDDFEYEGTHVVGTKKPNQLGIYDMNGNVWEWCTDWYDANFYSKSPSKNPYNSVQSYNKVERGGGWDIYSDYMNVNYRYFEFPTYKEYSIGFRICINVLFDT
ncbi:MAG: bifunctional serine/threonine-protein kinase/formylglycine-generating enzyme family protein [Cyanobacteriota bacterium]